MSDYGDSWLGGKPSALTLEAIRDAMRKRRGLEIRPDQPRVVMSWRQYREWQELGLIDEHGNLVLD